ncbi:hypothetical protein [Georgenia sp. AZ-5]|uniref:hypothetical protein n=1 Tax=Georgenia sp. AZ-5 TaxID=3367526 RepID=UPI003753E95E
MPTDERHDPRSALLRALMEKIQEDPYPSATMLDIVESLLTPRDVPAYVDELVERIRADQFPSIDLIQRVQNLF